MPKTKGNLLVIGARSLVGRRLRDAVQEARDRHTWPAGCEVRFTSRKPLAGQSLLLDLERPEDFAPDLVFTTVIVCTPIWLIKPLFLDRLKALGMKRLIVFSSTSRFTKLESGEAAERMVVQKLADGERVVLDYATRNDVAYTILRPTLIYDEGRDENVSQIAALILKLGFFPVCGKASGLRQPVHAKDLANAALQTVAKPACFNHCYNLSGGETLTYRAMVERVFKAMGKKPHIVSLPEWIWRIGFFILDFIRPNKTLKRNLDMALRMNADLWFDHAAATRDFGFKPESFKPQLTAPKDINAESTSL